MNLRLGFIQDDGDLLGGFVKEASVEFRVELLSASNKRSITDAELPTMWSEYYEYEFSFKSLPIVK